jgi:hypothetical protein
VVVALGESDAQVWRERKVSRGGRKGVVKAEELPALMG